MQLRVEEKKKNMHIFLMGVCMLVRWRVLKMIRKKRRKWLLSLLMYMAAMLKSSRLSTLLCLNYRAFYIIDC